MKIKKLVSIIIWTVIASLQIMPTIQADENADFRRKVQFTAATAKVLCKLGSLPLQNAYRKLLLKKAQAGDQIVAKESTKDWAIRKLFENILAIEGACGLAYELFDADHGQYPGVVGRSSRILVELAKIISNMEEKQILQRKQEALIQKDGITQEQDVLLDTLDKKQPYKSRALLSILEYASTLGSIHYGYHSNEKEGVEGYEHELFVDKRKYMGAEVARTLAALISFLEDKNAREGHGLKTDDSGYFATKSIILAAFTTLLINNAVSLATLKDISPEEVKKRAQIAEQERKKRADELAQKERERKEEEKKAAEKKAEEERKAAMAKAEKDKAQRKDKQSQNLLNRVEKAKEDIRIREGIASSLEEIFKEPLIKYSVTYKEAIKVDPSTQQIDFIKKKDELKWAAINLYVNRDITEVQKGIDVSKATLLKEIDEAIGSLEKTTKEKRAQNLTQQEIQLQKEKEKQKEKDERIRNAFDQDPLWLTHEWEMRGKLKEKTNQTVMGDWFEFIGFTGKLPVRKLHNKDGINRGEWSYNEDGLLIVKNPEVNKPNRMQRWVSSVRCLYKKLKELWPQTEEEWLDEAKLAKLVAYFHLPVALPKPLAEYANQNDVKESLRKLIMEKVGWVELILKVQSEAEKADKEENKANKSKWEEITKVEPNNEADWQDLANLKKLLATLPQRILNPFFQTIQGSNITKDGIKKLAENFEKNLNSLQADASWSDEVIESVAMIIDRSPDLVKDIHSLSDDITLSQIQEIVKNLSNDQRSILKDRILQSFRMNLVNVGNSENWRNIKFALTQLKVKDHESIDIFPMLTKEKQHELIEYLKGSTKSFKEGLLATGGCIFCFKPLNEECPQNKNEVALVKIEANIKRCNDFLKDLFGQAVSNARETIKQNGWAFLEINESSSLEKIEKIEKSVNDANISPDQLLRKIAEVDDLFKDLRTQNTKKLIADRRNKAHRTIFYIGLLKVQYQALKSKISQMGEKDKLNAKLRQRHISVLTKCDHVYHSECLENLDIHEPMTAECEIPVKLATEEIRVSLTQFNKVDVLTFTGASHPLNNKEAREKFEKEKLGGTSIDPDQRLYPRIYRVYISKDDKPIECDEPTAIKYYKEKSGVKVYAVVDIDSMPFYECTLCRSHFHKHQENFNRDEVHRLNINWDENARYEYDDAQPSS